MLSEGASVRLRCPRTCAFIRTSRFCYKSVPRMYQTVSRKPLSLYEILFRDHFSVVRTNLQTCRASLNPIQLGYKQCVNTQYSMLSAASTQETSIISMITLIVGLPTASTTSPAVRSLVPIARSHAPRRTASLRRTRGRSLAAPRASPRRKFRPGPQCPAAPPCSR